MVVFRRSAWSSAGIGKTVATVGRRRLAMRISTSLRRRGVAVKRKPKHLGIHFAPGGRTRELHGSSSRWAALSLRRKRAVRLGRRLGVHIFRTGLHLAALYGASVAIPRLSTIRDLRRSTARTMGSLSGRSVTARLAITCGDPSFDATDRVVMAWVNAVWDCRSLHNTMARAWVHDEATVFASKRLSQFVGRFAGSFVAALLRVGWRTLAFNHVRNIDGSLLDLIVAAPRTVLRHLVGDYSITSA